MKTFLSSLGILALCICTVPVTNAAPASELSVRERVSQLLMRNTLHRPHRAKTMAMPQNHEKHEHHNHDPQHSGHMMSPIHEDDAPTTKAFKEINRVMHEDMDIEYTGNVEWDFMAGMIPHHQGAVDMAKVLMDNTRDPGLRRFARDIILTQQKEISYMRQWMSKYRLTNRNDLPQ